MTAEKYKNIVNRLKILLFLSLIITSGVLRFVNLGYSDYQGDEIKAFWLPREG